MSITIERATNGYLLSWDEETENGIVKEKMVIEQTEDKYGGYETQDSEKIALGNLLTQIAEHFGFYYDKWSKDNLSIQFNLKGHKVDEE